MTELHPAFSDRTLFYETYRSSVRDVLAFWTHDMQQEIARHNKGWSSLDFTNYLEQSALRYWLACRALTKGGRFESLCDVGGFFGAFPLTLHRLGVRVSMTEALEYYSQSFAPLFDYLRKQGVEIIDIDPFEHEPPQDRQFDAVTAMAVIEHYPHSIGKFLNFMRKLKSETGLIYIEVPNIAYWPKRLNFMFGKTPLAPIEDIFGSAIPFIGHHHEYTMSEVRKVAELSGLAVRDDFAFNYSFQGTLLQRLISDPLLTVMTVRPSMRECLGAVLHDMAAATESSNA